MSITLDSKLVMNVYVPKAQTKSFTLDGVLYFDLSELSKNVVTLSDGKEYYLMKIELDSYLAARIVRLVVSIENGDNTANGTFTFSLLKYSGKVLDVGNEAEKQLISDILSFVRAACEYFTPENTETIKDINAIIGENYDLNNPHKEEGITDGCYEGLKSVTFKLTSTPAFIFYVEDGADISKYSFKVNGKDVSFKINEDSDGVYAEISLYAFLMCETVTYYIDGEEAGNYHIADYYDWAKAEQSETLLTVVERFWKYCQSAREYKNSVAASRAE